MTVIAAAGGGGNFGLLFFTWITFGLLVLLLGKFGWGPILNAIRSREERIQDDLTTAETEREKAEQLLQERKEELNEAHSDAKDILHQARGRAENTRQEIEQEAREKADSMVATAEKEIEADRRKAFEEVEGEVGQLALSLAEKVLGEEVNEDDHHRMIDEFLGEIKEGQVSVE